MPSVSDQTLTLTTVNQDVTINVTYKATITAFERQLVGLGMTIDEHIDVLGVDPPGSTTGTVLTSFPRTKLAVTTGSGSQVISRNVSTTVSRASLQEDPAAGDADEIVCKVRLHSQGIPPEFTDDQFTPQQVLLG